MKNIPLAVKLVINFFAYVCYTLFLSFAFSFLFPITLKLLGKNVLNSSDPVFTKIQIIIALLVLFVTFVFRKYFYISLSNNSNLDIVIEDKKVKSTNVIKNVDKIKDDLVDVFDKNGIDKKMKKKQEVDNYDFKYDDEEGDDEIKIYMDKDKKGNR